MKNIFVLSGLGADERVFAKINFGLHNVQHIAWILPLQNETIEEYALRLSTKITLPNPILIGLSFGGMVAIEIAKHIEVKKIILISSAKNYTEIPFYYRLIGKLKLNKIVSPSLLKKSNLFTNKFFSVRTKEEQILVAAMVKDTNPHLLKWSIDKIVNLQNRTVIPNLLHIHGNADKILPMKFVKPNIIINGGSHLMVITNANAVQVKILEALN